MWLDSHFTIHFDKNIYVTSQCLMYSDVSRMNNERSLLPHTFYGGQYFAKSYPHSDIVLIDGKNSS